MAIIGNSIVLAYSCGTRKGCDFAGIRKGFHFGRN